MESLIHAFGIDARLIIIQVINFVVLAGALSYLLYKPVLRMLNDREEKIRRGLDDAAAAAASRADAEDARKEVLAAAHQEAADVTARARTHAKEIGSEATLKAETTAASIIEEAKAKGAEIARRAQAESEAEIAKLAVLAAEKVLRQRAS